MTLENSILYPLLLFLTMITQKWFDVFEDFLSRISLQGVQNWGFKFSAKACYQLA